MLTAQLALLVVPSWQLGSGETFSLGLFDDVSLTGVVRWSNWPLILLCLRSSPEKLLRYSTKQTRPRRQLQGALRSVAWQPGRCIVTTGTALPA